jgi:Phage integrase, N-terminal SAM-like domain
VWVIGKGDSCDPFTENDAGRTPGSKLLCNTTRNYLRVVTEFAKHFGKSPDKLGPNELRTYQAYLLTECKLTPGSVINQVAALRFFFVKTLKRHQFREFLSYPRDRRRLPTVLRSKSLGTQPRERLNKANTILESDMIRGCFRLALPGPLPSRSQVCSSDHR